MGGVFSLLSRYYIVDSGATGAMEAMMCMGVGYFSIMMLSALTLKRPAPGYKPEGFVPPPPIGGKGASRGGRHGGALLTPPPPSTLGAPSPLCFCCFLVSRLTGAHHVRVLRATSFSRAYPPQSPQLPHPLPLPSRHVTSRAMPSRP